MVAPVPADPPSVVEQLVRRLLAFLFALTAFTAALSIATSPRSANPVELENEKLGAIILRIPVPDLPPHVYSVVVRLQRGITPPVEDSVVIVDVAGDTARMQFSLEPGEWTMTIRGRDFSGGTRYAGIAAVGVQAGQYSTATVRMNADAALSDRPEVVLRWGTRPERWRMSLNNPVLAPDFVGWDQDHYYVSYPCVIKVADTLHMWYASGYNGYYSTIDSMWCAYATSIDGETWVKHGQTHPQKPFPSWMPGGFLARAVLYENGIFKTWFEARGENDSRTGIGFAHSHDGREWEVQEKPLLTGTSENSTIFGPAIVRHNGIYYLYYSVRWQTNGQTRQEIELMTSPDGLQWTSRGGILKRRANISWETGGVCRPSVFLSDSGFVMYYTATYLTRSGNVDCVGKASSRDGIRWTHLSLTPELEPGDTDPWPSTLLSSPCVLMETGRLSIWFASFSPMAGRWAIGRATRPFDRKRR